MLLRLDGYSALDYPDTAEPLHCRGGGSPPPQGAARPLLCPLNSRSMRINAPVLDTQRPSTVPADILLLFHTKIERKRVFECREQQVQPATAQSPTARSNAVLGAIKHDLRLVKGYDRAVKTGACVQVSGEACCATREKDCDNEAREAVFF